MRVDAWGCIRKFATGEEVNPYSFNAGIGVESVKVLEDLCTWSARRVLRVTLVQNSCSPIWLTFDSLDEAKTFLSHLKRAVERYSKDKDYEGGKTPIGIILY